MPDFTRIKLELRKAEILRPKAKENISLAVTKSNIERNSINPSFPISEKLDLPQKQEQEPRNKPLSADEVETVAAATPKLKALLIKPTKATRSQEKEALIEFNRQRDKNEEQRIREGKLLESIYSDRAKLEMIKASHPKQNVNVAVPTLAHQHDIKVNTVEENKTRHKVADDVGMKRTTYTKVEDRGYHSLGRRWSGRSDAGRINIIVLM